MKHGYGKTVIDSFVKIPQRQAVCPKCSSKYTGPKLEVDCKSCGKKLQTVDLRCEKKVPTGTWLVSERNKGK